MNFDALLTLVSTSIVKTGLLPSTKVYGRPERLQFKEDVTAKGTCKDIPCKVYNVTTATAGADSFLSYICDYKTGEINYQVLGPGANFCFTTTMNGCTFGIGSPTADGSVLVSHANMAVPRVPTAAPALGPGLLPPGDQADAPTVVARALHGPGASYLTPDCTGMTMPTSHWSVAAPAPGRGSSTISVGFGGSPNIGCSASTRSPPPRRNSEAPNP